MENVTSVFPAAGVSSQQGTVLHHVQKHRTQTTVLGCLSFIPAAPPAHAVVFPVSCCTRHTASLCCRAAQVSDSVLPYTQQKSGCGGIGRLGGRG